MSSKAEVDRKEDGDVYLILLAAGRGERLKENIPKALVKISDRSILQIAAKNLFLNSSIFSKMIVAYPATYQDRYKEELGVLNSKAIKNEEILFVQGGNTRADSVKNALQLLASLPIKSTDIIFIHDAARCFTSHDLLENILMVTHKHKAVTCAVKVKDTIKEVNVKSHTVEQTLQRDLLWSVQTPQAFYFELLKNAHEMADRSNNFTPTDDASVVEKISSVYVVQGEEQNFKITTPIDLELAKIYESKCFK